MANIVCEERFSNDKVGSGWRPHGKRRDLNIDLEQPGRGQWKQKEKGGVV